MLKGGGRWMLHGVDWQSLGVQDLSFNISCGVVHAAQSLFLPVLYQTYLYLNKMWQKHNNSAMLQTHEGEQ